MSAKIDIDREGIADFCRRNHIAKLSLFGSVLRDDFTPEGDVDVLVEFEPGHVPGFGSSGCRTRSTRCWAGDASISSRPSS